MQNSGVLMLLLILKKLTIVTISAAQAHKLHMPSVQYSLLDHRPVLFQFNYLLILWTSSLLWYYCLLLLVGGWLRLGALESVVADAVVD